MKPLLKQISNTNKNTGKKYRWMTRKLPVELKKYIYKKIGRYSLVNFINKSDVSTLPM